MDMNKIKERMLNNEKHLTEYACFDKDCIRLKENIEDFRSNYARDVDRIIHSTSYTKYMDKTQVFSIINNDNISKRMTHVQLVSKIARTIGRALALNEDLIEAIALGHDIGHVPFGHVGESILNKISLENNEGNFMHNVQSVRTLMYVEKQGNGVNLSIQTLDGILCHNGEFVEDKYYPTKKTKEDFLNDYEKCYTDEKHIKTLRPMTLEGCVVRISDIIGYIGRDIEDAISLGMIKFEEVPKEITDVLGTSNKEMINTIIVDIINNSIDKDYIKMSKDVYESIKALKAFNYENIYYKATPDRQMKLYDKMFRFLFDYYLYTLKTNYRKESIYINFLNNMNEEYLKNTSDERKIIDYIAGMTDETFIAEYDRLKNHYM